MDVKNCSESNFSFATGARRQTRKRCMCGTKFYTTVILTQALINYCRFISMNESAPSREGTRRSLKKLQGGLTNYFYGQNVITYHTI